LSNREKISQKLRCTLPKFAEFHNSNHFHDSSHPSLSLLHLWSSEGLLDVALHDDDDGDDDDEEKDYDNGDYDQEEYIMIVNKMILNMMRI
jgi:hypothetical protein